MTQNTRFVFASLAALFTVTAHAQDEEGFFGRIGLGYLATSGNSDSESLNLNFDLAWHYDPWTHTFGGLAIKSSAAGVTTSDAYGFAWQSRYAINDTDYVFGRLALDKDKFSAYDQQVREVVGYGRRFINREQHQFNAEAGVGARQADLRNGVSEDETVIYLGADYTWTISETSSFSQTLSIENGSSNTFTQATSALSSEIRDDLALVISYTIKNNSDVLPTIKETDTFTAISLEYKF